VQVGVQLAVSWGVLLVTASAHHHRHYLLLLGLGLGLLRQQLLLRLAVCPQRPVPLVADPLAAQQGRGQEGQQLPVGLLLLLLPPPGHRAEQHLLLVAAPLLRPVWGAAVRAALR
jgi:hypothetical protein